MQDGYGTVRQMAVDGSGTAADPFIMQVRGVYMTGPAIAAFLNPLNANNTVTNTGYVDLHIYAEVLFVVELGAVDSTVDFKLRQADDTSGTNEADLTGKAITQLGGTDDNKKVVVHMKASELTASGRYVRGRLTVGNGTTNIVSVVALGFLQTYTAVADPLAAQVVP